MRVPFLLLLAAAAFAETKHRLPVTPETVIVGYYDPATPPALRIASGDTVVIDTLGVAAPQALEAAGVPAAQIQPELRAVVKAKPEARGHFLTGPVYVEGAEPGDLLEVQILDVKMPVPYSYNAMGAAGVLADEFTIGKRRIIWLDRDRLVGKFAPNVEVPLRPFFGSMGVAPPLATGRITSRAPGIHAGNMDNRELIAGTKVFIPVHVSGALFQVGDGHAAQGDGEVDVTGLETSLQGTFRFVVHKAKTLAWPRGETPTHYIAMGFDESLDRATKLAVQQAVSFLVTEKGLSKEDAYMLISVGVDLHITQLVDGNKGVHAMIPKRLFVP
jgi:acetamidase/formamidase